MSKKPMSRKLKAIFKFFAAILVINVIVGVAGIAFMMLYYGEVDGQGWAALVTFMILNTIFASPVALYLYWWELHPVQTPESDQYNDHRQ
ncbi:hypothetical protein KZO85_04145 [Chromohalobacter canadensis]|jgi:hypothetical protein|uniref:hypothetical protein n=1 Tax=Chromohalobacter canadensis TaxID=141389 RepID=UPI0021BE148D|nr:hypothetical protein [Chromohalobacter canadensis]MCT8467765.1 hypothetical protein [Chromohalobacter canadensis]MCT8470487.1 hypothetical protein [Chromohalobacter canadensis]MCT8498262.1 hypothetical protein [Chromohalobacter canadensis]